jgi:hypothetical protein
MADIAKVRKAPVKVDIGDGQERHLRYTLNAFALLEEKYGTMEKAMEALESGSIIAIRYILWAGLVHEDSELTELYVGNQIDLSDLEGLADKMNKAMMGDLPVPEDGDSDPN